MNLTILSDDMASAFLPPIQELIDTSQRSLSLTYLAIAFNPTFWNIVAQNEYHNKTITRYLACGNRRVGCYLLAVTIFSLGIIRDSIYHDALQHQPKYSLLPYPLNVIVPAVLFVYGQLLVVSSTYVLGVTGTFLGDYFGILMDQKVTGFPFNLYRDPMYLGSTLCFAATALWYERPAGLFVTLFVHIVYQIALKFEGPFTDQIYANKDKDSKKVQ